MATPAPATFAQLLEHAVNEPGILSSAYRQFYGYSLGNVLLALSQCWRAGFGLDPSPRSNAGRNWGDSCAVARRPSHCVGRSPSRRRGIIKGGLTPTRWPWIRSRRATVGDVVRI